MDMQAKKRTRRTPEERLHALEAEYRRLAARLAHGK
jgi:hypothetical protein